MYYLESESKVFAVTSISQVDVHAILQIILNKFVLHARQRALTAFCGHVSSGVERQSRVGKVARLEDGRGDVSPRYDRERGSLEQTGIL